MMSGLWVYKVPHTITVIQHVVSASLCFYYTEQYWAAFNVLSDLSLKALSAFSYQYGMIGHRLVSEIETATLYIR